jgi:hypothetical protein
MAKAAGHSLGSVQRIWRAHSLQPHRVRHFKLSKDPRFIDKLRDVVGLYVDPPAHAIVLSQAFERCDLRFILLQHIRCLGILIKGACLVFVDPDADQLPRNIVPFR